MNNKSKETQGTVQYRMSDSNLIDSVGIYHNMGVDTVLNYFDANPHEPVHVNVIYSVANNYLRNYGFTRHEFDTTDQVLVMGWYNEQDFEELFDMVEYAVSLIVDSLIQQEKEMLTDFMVKMNTLTSTQFESYCDSMRSEFYGKSWSLNKKDGELVGGAINIGVASSEIEWENTDPVPGGNAISVDAAAYLLRWAQLYNEECIVNAPPDSEWYDECPGGESRIRRSAEFALSISILRGMGR